MTISNYQTGKMRFICHFYNTNKKYLMIFFSVKRILEPAIFFVLSKSEEAPFVEPLSHSLSDGLPCGCRFVNSDDRPFEDTGWFRDYVLICHLGNYL